MSQEANNDVANIAKHFGLYFEPILALDEKLVDEAHRIRHNVYCEELAFEPVKEDGMEQDDFDQFSYSCLIRHRERDQFAGTVRLVRPQEEGQKLPIELYCSHALEGVAKHPDQFDRKHICEISRLAVPANFRRRKMDRHEGAATGVINQETYSVEELRCFPFISIGLYLSAAALCYELDIDHVFVMMEPRLARSMRLVGINFEQLGPTVEYHGKRAPFYIYPKELLTSLAPAFQLLLESIDKELYAQKKEAVEMGLLV